MANVEGVHVSSNADVVVVLALAWMASVAQILLSDPRSPAIIVVYAAPFLIWKSIKKR